MKIIFCGNMYDDINNEMKKMKRPNGASQHKFQINLLKGLMGNTENIYVINTSMIRFFPNYPEKIHKAKKFKMDGKVVGKSTGFINLFGIHYLSRYISVKRELQEYINKNVSNGEKCIIMTFNNYLPLQLSMLKCKYKNRNKNIYICVVIGDILSKTGKSWLFNSYGFVKSLILTFMNKLADNLSRKFDCFVFLTKDMAHALKIENKPYVVMEGFYDVCKNNNNCDQSNGNLDEDCKMIFYAGSLREEYGIVHLIKAFEIINDKNYRLYLAGQGGTEKIIKEYIEKDRRIKYLGYITPQEVELLQRKATVLISPRVYGNNTFVKYSFPSKTMECLASGKPYIAHKLPCDPPEYADYIQYAKDETDKALAEKIVEICSLPESERNEIGLRAKKFIEKEKNPIVMTQRIVEMFQKIGESKITFYDELPF